MSKPRFGEETVQHRQTWCQVVIVLLWEASGRSSTRSKVTLASSCFFPCPSRLLFYSLSPSQSASLKLSAFSRYQRYPEQCLYVCLSVMSVNLLRRSVCLLALCVWSCPMCTSFLALSRSLSQCSRAVLLCLWCSFSFSLYYMYLFFIFPLSRLNLGALVLCPFFFFSLSLALSLSFPPVEVFSNFES